MTYLDWGLLGVFFISLVLLMVMLIRKAPQLVVIDVETIAKEREARVRERLLRARIERRFAQLFHWRPLHTLAHEMDHLAHTLEEEDQHATEVHAPRAVPQTIDALAARIAEIEKDRSHGFLAESDDGHTVVPAEAVSDQVLAALHTALGGLLAEAGQQSEALQQYENAVVLIPNNPKYLDALLTTAILLRNRERAAETLVQLKVVNPENEKIEEFEKQVAALTPAKRGKKK